MIFHLRIIYTNDWQDVTINHPNLQTFTCRNKNKRRSYESQAQSPHLVAGKSEQNITTVKPFSLEPTWEDGVTSSCSFMMHCTLVEWNAFWSKVMNSRICTPFYILFLNPDYVAARSIRTLCGNKHFSESITRKFKPSFFVQQCQKQRLILPSTRMATLCYKSSNNNNSDIKISKNV